MAQKKAEYTKPSSQLDLERRLADGNKSNRVLSTSDSYRETVEEGDGRDMTVEGNDLSGYLGVDPDYQNYAEETDKPLEAEEGVDKDLLDEFYERVDPHPTKVEEPSGESDPVEVGSTTSTVSPAVPASPEQETSLTGKGAGETKKD